MTYLTPRKALRNAYRKSAVDSTVFNDFKDNYEHFKRDINENESEEFNKGIIKDFLSTLGYSGKYLINPSGRVDMAVYGDNTADSNIQVIIENKKPTEKTDMVSIHDFKKKSFAQIILYYMREKIKYRNYDIRHLVITNSYEWFIFDAKEIDKISRHKLIDKLYHDFEINPNLFTDKTNDFYKYSLEIIKAENLTENITFSRFYTKEKQSDAQLTAIYKLLTPTHLMKLPFENDSNSLNSNFYQELLYIIGLEEIKDGGKKLIVRQKPKNRQFGSFIENTIIKLKTEQQLDNIDDLSIYGKTEEEQLFNIALELNITWLNRILFLKLFEAKLLTIHQDNYIKFLSPEIIKDLDILNTLFFEVLSIPIDKRDSLTIGEFQNIPYLNSSLFEVHALEKKTMRISNLKDNLKLKPHSQTILRDSDLRKETNPLSSLNYLIRFLNAYDFGTYSKEEIRSENKTLINSSVLGLIFEKINGYKEGSFYTPSFITMYMSRDTIRQKVVELFSNQYGIQFVDFHELRNYCFKYNHKDDFIDIANDLINSITICDPAVGSGHFLVSSLNEVLAIKSELGVLVNEEKKDLGFDVSVENDELYIVDRRTGDIVEYQLQATETSAVQKTLFHEKQTIIENQLFGVDINPNSSKICQLRLWIELLKSTYYDEENTLVTLPNIDINIKTGNSLISRYEVDEDITIDVQDYKDDVLRYKETNDKQVKKELLKHIDELKNSFTTKLHDDSPLVVKLKKELEKYLKEFGFEELNEELIFDYAPKIYFASYQRGINPSDGLFGAVEKKPTKRKSKLKSINSFYESVKEIESGKDYKHAFEWRFEFPETLNSNGDFEGFDIILGNPPYIMEDENKEAFNGLHSNPCYQGKTDLWHIFACQGVSLLKTNGLLSFIAKNQWMENQAATNMRSYLYSTVEIQSIIDFGTNMIFDEASQQTMIFKLCKQQVDKAYEIDYKKFATKLSNDLLKQALNDETKLRNELKEVKKPFDNTLGADENLTFSTPIAEKMLFHIAKKKNFKFDENEIIQGLIGGPDEAFIVQSSEVSQFNPLEQSYLRPFHTSTIKYFTPSTAEQILYLSKKNFHDIELDDFPNIMKKLTPFRVIEGGKKGLDLRRETLKGTIAWYNLWWPRDEAFFATGEKLIWAKRTAGQNFSYVYEQFYGTANLFFLKTQRVNLKYITALLNSKIIGFWLEERCKHTGDLLQVDKNQFMKIPIYIPTLEEQEPIIKNVDEIIRLKKLDTNADISSYEEEMNKLIYNLYGLSLLEM